MDVVKEVLGGVAGFLVGLVGLVVVLALIGGCFLLALWTMESWHNYWLSSVAMLGGLSILGLIRNLIWG